MVTTDLVVLIDADARPVGTAARGDVHTDRTPLHLAFSCYLSDGAGRVLLTRRALAKRSWPGVWTNSFCGHPRPGEDLAAAVHRYAGHELGTSVKDVRCVLPSFQYRATDPSGIVENELCPVFVAEIADDLQPNPDEVVDLRWVPAEHLRTLVSVAPWTVSPWLVDQVIELQRHRLWETLT
jgi:isopentenyl-diphosphate delta-isomerase